MVFIAEIKNEYGEKIAHIRDDGTITDKFDCDKLAHIRDDGTITDKFDVSKIGKIEPVSDGGSDLLGGIVFLMILFLGYIIYKAFKVIKEIVLGIVFVTETIFDSIVWFIINVVPTLIITALIGLVIYILYTIIDMHIEDEHDTKCYVWHRKRKKEIRSSCIYNEVIKCLGNEKGSKECVIIRPNSIKIYYRNGENKNYKINTDYVNDNFNVFIYCISRSEELEGLLNHDYLNITNINKKNRVAIFYSGAKENLNKNTYAEIKKQLYYCE